MNELSFPLKKLWFAHVFIIVLSNYAVQIPILMFGCINSTLGTFTYPFIFLATDLTVRIYGQKKARIVIFSAMIPALIISYLVGTVFAHGSFQGIDNLSTFNSFVFRIALASFSAYVLGQLADIFVFQKLRQLKKWWPAPAASSVFGNMLDTYAFFAVAFYHTTDAFMAANWMEIATVDYAVKMAASLIIFVPVYGVFLSFINKYILKNQSCMLSASLR
ncbi:MAG TPA: 7-cyano-7-deazaguanine/7-aminomethyl-7-deazaguanine transporter [Succinivibrionaceae bacterium]|nr:7-cyano-7-deazaguanine/7-aminomethyl-7-deazaguanine transporter [Succinivibrio sp.]HAR79504.1 7-cyano-7-deazaguanine/7-aminomethyl-7-deazaguanine transporter [Succinivibrionaceae bacterium]